MLRATLASLAALLLTGQALYAQSDASIGAGVALTLYDMSGNQVQTPEAVGLIGRLRRGSGFGGTLGLEWYRSNVQTEVGGQSVALGTMNVRPIMVGPSYVKQYHRFALSGALVAGYSFNELRGTGAAQAAYAARLGVTDASFSLSNCVAGRTDVTLWYEVGKHVGVSASVAYLLARPTLTTTSSLGRRSQTLDGSGVLFTVGVAYGVF